MRHLFALADPEPPDSARHWNCGDPGVRPFRASKSYQRRETGAGQRTDYRFDPWGRSCSQAPAQRSNGRFPQSSLNSTYHPTHAKHGGGATCSSFAAPAAKAAVIVLAKERDRIEVLRSLDRAAPTCICGVTGVRNAPRCNVDAAPEAHTLHRQWLTKG
jgi:hypothetical protein